MGFTLLGIAPPDSAASQETRPVIILIHGRNQMRYSDRQLDSMWYGAFREGLSKLGVPNIMGPHDYTLVKYQDIYRDGVRPVCRADEERRRARTAPVEARREGARRRASSARIRADREEFLIHSGTRTLRASAAPQAGPLDKREVRRLAQKIEEAEARRDAALEEAFQAEAEAQQAEAELRVQNAAADAEEAALDAEWPRPFAIAWDKLIEGVTTPIPAFPPMQKLFLEHVFTDTQKYIEDRKTACATTDRLDAALISAGRRPIILVGHSMGTLVSYDRIYDLDQGMLGGGRALNVRRFVTLGSQLGVEDLVRGLVGDLRPLPVPRSIDSWVNLRGHDDWVSPRRVDGHYENRATPPLTFAEYRIQTIPGDPHAIQGYFQNVATMRAIVFAWCAAFPDAGNRPSECAQITRDVRPGDGGARRIARNDPESAP
jgi:hypothetical protein